MLERSTLCRPTTIFSHLAGAVDLASTDHDLFASCWRCRPVVDRPRL